MNNVPTAVAIGVIIAGSLLVGFQAGTSNRQVTSPISVVSSISTQTLDTVSTQTLDTVATETITSFSTDPPSFCTQSGNHTVPSHPVLMMKARSTGLVCVLYSWGPSSGQQGLLNEKNAGGVGNVWLLAGLLKSPQSFIAAGGINMTDVWAIQGSNSKTVVYAIRTSGNSSGIYAWWPQGACQGFPLVVGMNITSARPTLMGYYSASFNCSSTTFSAEIEGALGVATRKA